MAETNETNCIHGVPLSVACQSCEDEADLNLSALRHAAAAQFFRFEDSLDNDQEKHVATEPPLPNGEV